jgi:hypothetical protein
MIKSPENLDIMMLVWEYRSAGGRYKVPDAQ